VISPIPKRLISLGVVLVVIAVLPASVAASTYGRLVVRHNAPPGSTLETQFAHVRPPDSFVLVVTEPEKTQLQFKWSVHCYNAARRSSGGASGEATVASGHWVKRIRVNWIKHPAYCSGNLVGLAASSPVLVRVFAD
jgi:protein-S-isoprenylcysteine O-methyltransferase Ste14